MLRQPYAGISGESQSHPYFVYLLTDNSYFPPTFDDKYKHKKTKRQVLIDFDFVGLILLVGGMLIFLMGISWGGSLYAWKSAHVIGCIVVGFVTLVAFVLYESLMPLNEPLVPMHLFKNVPWVATMMVVSLGASVYYAFAIVWPTMVFAVFTSDLTYGGWLCVVPGCGINAGQLLGGLLARRLGKQRIQIIVGSISMCIWLGGMSPPFPFPCNRTPLTLSSLCMRHPRQQKDNHSLPLPGHHLRRLPRLHRFDHHRHRHQRPSRVSTISLYSLT